MTCFGIECCNIKFIIYKSDVQATHNNQVAPWYPTQEIQSAACHQVAQVTLECTDRWTDLEHQHHRSFQAHNQVTF